MMFLLPVACVQSPAPPSAPPDVSASPASTGTSEPTPPPPASAGPVAGTHCVAGERVAFSCATRDDKVLSVCAGPAADALQYRFGPVGSPELVYPPEPSAQAFTLGEVQYMHAEGSVLRFENNGVKYEVTSLVGGGGSPEQGASNNFQGVYVYTARGKVVGVGCAGAVDDQLPALRASGAVPPLAER